VKLAERNRVQLLWVLGNMGIDENERAGQLAREGSSHPLMGPECVIGISAKFAWGGGIRDWMSRKHEQWQFMCTKGRLRAFLKYF